MNVIKHGFEPFYRPDSRLLILGSFPSVKSRQVEFYYGNPQNRFWKILADFFGGDKPLTVEEKKEFLCRHQIALWDIVTQCEIVGSSDATIKNFQVADLGRVLACAPIERIVVNGGTAYKIFLKHYADISTPYIKLPSTSPANTRCDEKEWMSELSRTFG